MECIIGLKNGGVKYFTLPEKSESYKYLQKAYEMIAGASYTQRSYKDTRRYLCLTLKGILNAPKGTKFWYDFSEKRYTKRKAIDYILSYDLDDEGDFITAHTPQDKLQKKNKLELF